MPTSDRDPGARWRSPVPMPLRAMRGIRGAHELLPLPVFAVGRRTAEAARTAGFADVIVGRRRQGRSGRGSIAAHARRAARRCSIWRAKIAPAISPAASPPAGIAVRTARSIGPSRRRRFRRRAGRAGGGALDGVLHFSRRSAETYVDCANGRRHWRARRWRHALLPVARRWQSRLAAAGAATLAIAPRPDEAASEWR